MCVCMCVCLCLYVEEAASSILCSFVWAFKLETAKILSSGVPVHSVRCSWKHLWWNLWLDDVLKITAMCFQQGRQDPHASSAPAQPFSVLLSPYPSWPLLLSLVSSFHSISELFAMGNWQGSRCADRKPAVGPPQRKKLKTKVQRGCVY